MTPTPDVLAQAAEPTLESADRRRRHLEAIKSHTDAMSPYFDESGQFPFDRSAIAIDNARLADYAVSVLASSPTQEEPRWRPISEGPKDGTLVLTYRPGRNGRHGHIGTLCWIGDTDDPDGVFKNTWGSPTFGSACPDNDQPTHFMPLPAAPVGETVKEEKTP